MFNDASGSSLLLVSCWQLLDLEPKLRRIVLPETGSRFWVSRYKFFTSFWLQTNELFNNSDGQRDELCSQQRKRRAFSIVLCLFVFTGFTRLKSAVGFSFYTPKGSSTGQNGNKLQSARVLQHRDPCWGRRARFDVFSSQLKYFSP